MKIRHRDEERRASFALDQLVSRPRGEYAPSTFSLSESELRAEARRLHAAGWSTADIVAVLAIEPTGRTSA